VSVQFPESLLLLWCDNDRDVFLASSPDPGELGRVLTTLRRQFRARAILRDGSDALLAVPEYHWAKPPSVTGLARRSDVWVVHPVVYFGGTETYRFVAPTKSTLQRLILRLRAMGDVELLSVSDRADLRAIRDLPTATVHFFEGLTDRQAGTLVAAYEGGLLDVPARAKWGDVARRSGLSRSTFGEHLRKGQLRLLANSYATLKARTLAPERPVLLPALTRARARRGRSASADP
jgi:predicted DNA binding protein